MDITLCETFHFFLLLISSSYLFVPFIHSSRCSTKHYAVYFAMYCWVNLKKMIVVCASCLNCIANVGTKKKQQKFTWMHLKVVWRYLAVFLSGNLQLMIFKKGQYVSIICWVFGFYQRFHFKKLRMMKIDTQNLGIFLVNCKLLMDVWTARKSDFCCD